MNLPQDELPLEIAKQIDLEWRKNESAYWAMRDGLLNQFQGQWIGFADGRNCRVGNQPGRGISRGGRRGQEPVHYLRCA